MEPQFNVNLDAMGILELNKFIDNCKLMSKYARLKTYAICYRQQGDIQCALQVENRMDFLYTTMPQECKSW